MSRVRKNAVAYVTDHRKDWAELSTPLPLKNGWGNKDLCGQTSISKHDSIVASSHGIVRNGTERAYRVPRPQTSIIMAL